MRTDFSFSFPYFFWGILTLNACNMQNALAPLLAFLKIVQQIYLINMVGHYSVYVGSASLWLSCIPEWGWGLATLPSAGCPEHMADFCCNLASLLLFTGQVHGNGPASTLDLTHCQTSIWCVLFPLSRLSKATQNLSQKCSCRPTLTAHPHDFSTSEHRCAGHDFMSLLFTLPRPRVLETDCSSPTRQPPRIQPYESGAADSTSPVKFPKVQHMGVCLWSWATGGDDQCQAWPFPAGSSLMASWAHSILGRDLGSNPGSAMHSDVFVWVLTKNGPGKMEVIITTVKHCWKD